ncbi:MAG: hypothetical protein K9G59_15130 [Caulobacter sp.]|nr:hypothetical protein [Caulobacter sp.]
MARSVLKLSDAEALAAAKAKAKELFGLIGTVMMFHANNRHLIYGKELSSQLPNSYAGHAFQNLQAASFGMQLIRLMALWDRASADRTSIPTIAALIDRDSVRAEMRRLHLGDWHDAGPQFLHDTGARFDKLLRRATRWALAVEKSQRVDSLRDHRDAFIAHNLGPATDYKSPKYGQERRLLATTYRIANMLNVVLNNTSTAYEMTDEMCRKYAEDLWVDCRFGVLERQQREEEARQARLAEMRARRGVRAGTSEATD